MIETLSKVHCTIAFFICLVLVHPGSILAANTNYKKSVEQYKVPDVTLIDQNGQPIELQAYLNDGKPVILDFIYGTCTTICPILSAGFAHFQKKLGADAEKVRMVSISIDPDNDTPSILKEYLGKYGARPGWDSLTGKRDMIISVLKEFDAYVANKMNHYPLTIMKGPGDKEWIRLYGMLSAADLKNEYEQLMNN